MVVREGSRPPIDFGLAAVALIGGILLAAILTALTVAMFIGHLVIVVLVFPTALLGWGLGIWSLGAPVWLLAHRLGWTGWRAAATIGFALPVATEHVLLHLETPGLLIGSEWRQFAGPLIILGLIGVAGAALIRWIYYGPPQVWNGSSRSGACRHEKTCPPSLENPTPCDLPPPAR